MGNEVNEMEKELQEIGFSTSCLSNEGIAHYYKKLIIEAEVKVLEDVKTLLLKTSTFIKEKTNSL